MATLHSQNLVIQLEVEMCDFVAAAHYTSWDLEEEGSGSAMSAEALTLNAVHQMVVEAMDEKRLLSGVQARMIMSDTFDASLEPYTQLGRKVGSERQVRFISSSGE